MPIAQMTQSGRVLAPADLDELERRLAVRLPVDYRDFLLRHNGGRPKPAAFPLVDGDESRLDLLYGVSDDEQRDVAEQTAWLEGDHILPDTIAVGVDAGGNHLCLGVAAHNLGKVYFVDHEELEGDTLDERAIELAGSWTEFEASIGQRE